MLCVRDHEPVGATSGRSGLSAARVRDAVAAAVGELRSPTLARLAAYLGVNTSDVRSLLSADAALADHVRQSQRAVQHAKRNRLRELEQQAIEDGTYIPYREPQDLARHDQRESGRISPRRRSPHL